MKAYGAQDPIREGALVRRTTERKASWSGPRLGEAQFGTDGLSINGSLWNRDIGPTLENSKLVADVILQLSRGGDVDPEQPGVISGRPPGVRVEPGCYVIQIVCRTVVRAPVAVIHRSALNL